MFPMSLGRPTVKIGEFQLSQILAIKTTDSSVGVRQQIGQEQSYVVHSVLKKIPSRQQTGRVSQTVHSGLENNGM